MVTDCIGDTEVNIVKPAEILIPQAADMTAWSVVACDQFTSEPEYWEKVHEIAEGKPSALHLILPEAELSVKDPEVVSEKINQTMTEYLSRDIFAVYHDSYVYLERTLSDGSLRRGIVGAFDLECYDWHEGTVSPIRATEHTVEDRLPPRVRVREKAPLEMPHIMIFMDDAENAVMNSVRKGEKLYDFELMQGGGHITGWRVSDNAALENALDSLADAEKLRAKYGDAEAPIIFAMGDGNHSIAAAKQHWENVKKTIPEEMREVCPARYALAELVNIHDRAIVFEPIHKLVYDTDPKDFFKAAKAFFADRRGDGREITLITADGEEKLSICGLTLGELIGECESFCVKYTEAHGGKIDYIHGDETCTELSGRESCAGILLPRMDKSELFTSVMKSGPFPKKSFSIGHGPDKRYYLECRKIV